MTNEVERIAAMRDRFEILREATARISAAQQELTELAYVRRRVIQELHDMGMSYAEIAQQVGLTRGRIHQIRHAGPPPEAAFLGLGRISIVTALQEAATGAPPLVAAEHVAAAQRLGELARALGLVPSYESMPMGGGVDLNRPNLVVICGPGSSRPVAEVLARDPHLGFEQAADGRWVLVERPTGSVYRSGQDETPARDWDVAYLGRLPRPDGHGSLIVLAGLHPPGSLGAVELLCTRLGELYADVGTQPFSVLVGTEYEPVTQELRRVEPLSALYRLEPG